MAELTHDEQDELTKAAYEPGSSCAHNMVPLIRAVEEIVDARVKKALDAAADLIDEAGEYLTVIDLVDHVRAMAGEGSDG